MIYGYVTNSELLSPEKQRQLIGHCDKVILLEPEAKKSLQMFLEEPAAVYHTKSKVSDLGQLVQKMKQGDTLKVASLEVLNLSVLQLIELVDYFNMKKITLESVTDLMPQQEFFSKLALIQRSFRRKATLPSLAAARARGRNGGRKKGLSKDAKTAAIAAASLYQKGELSANEICKSLNIKSRATLYRYLRHEGIEIGKLSGDKKTRG